MRDFTPMEVVRWNVPCLLLTIAVTQGNLIFTSDKQYAQLQGNITLTCNTSESLSAVEFQGDVSRLGICRIEVGCSTSNESKFSLNSNLQPVGYDIYTITIKKFEVNDTGLYRCLTFDTSWQYSTIQITHAVDINSVKLTPKTNLISVIENVPQIFQCVTSTCRPVATISWYLGSKLIKTGNESNTLQDVTTSTLNYTFQKKHQDKRILCRGSNGGQVLTSDNQPRLNVLYGPSKPACRLGGSALSSVVTVREGLEFRLNCTSDGNPLPSFSWIHPGDGPSSRLIINSIKRTHSGRFRIIAENNLNPLEQQPVYLRVDMRLTVNVQYPPDTPQCQLGETAISTNTVTAIREQMITISCSCDSNPPSTYWWYGDSFSKSGQDLRLFVQIATTINFTMENSMQFTIGNSEQGRRVSPFEIKVLFPPVVKPLTNVTVIEEGTVSVVCEVTAGVPSKNDFKWERMSDMTKVSREQTLSIASIDRKQAGYYECTALNYMEPTGHDATVGKSSNTVYIDVQFPPVVKPLTNVTVIEEGTVSVVCEITAGVPSKNDFKWDRMSDSTKVSMEQTLSIANIDRKQTGYYRCTASNYMEPTGHDATVGKSSNTVYIDVQYEAEVASFTLSNANHGQNFEVNENTQVIFYCQAHSNPSSNLALLKQSQYLKTASDAKQLNFTISKSVCEDEGIYQCTAQNEHNTKANIRSFELFVRCAPRASALSRRDQNVTIAPGEPAAFTLKLVAFPRPRAKDFVWEKKVSASSTWYIVSNDTDIVITVSADGLQTKLFFSSVDRKDFGYYRVHVNNELGNYTETFLLQAQDDSVGSVIAGAVCGTLAAVVVVTVGVVILRRKYIVNCNFERKRDVTAAYSVSDTDNPENNAVHTYDEVSMANAASVYDALNDRGNGCLRVNTVPERSKSSFVPDDRDLYTPLNDSSSKNVVHYENVKKEDHVYNNMMLRNPV